MKLTIKAILENFEFITNDEKRFAAEDILFNDTNFNIEFFICNFGTFFSPNRVLVSPMLISEVDLMDNKIYLDMDSKHLKDGPNPDYKLPVSSEFSKDYFNYSAFPYYYGFGVDMRGIQQVEAYRRSQIDREKKSGRPNHTRSMNEIRSYNFVTTDDKKGGVTDWILDTDIWRLTAFGAALGGLWNKDHYLLSTDSVNGISFIDRTIDLGLTFGEVLNHTPFNPEKKVNQNDEVTHYDYYGRPQESESIQGGM